MKRPQLVALSMILLLGGCLAAPGYEGDVADNFDGKTFVNRTPTLNGPADMVKLSYEALTKMNDWPDWVETTPGQVPLSEEGIVVTFINHATLLLTIDGVNILTDPIFSQRASPFSFAGPKRVHAPGIALSDLPDIDVILISHNHYDHLDLDSLRAITAQQQARKMAPPMILAGLGNSALLTDEGLSNNQELDWDDARDILGMTFHFTECRHRSGRGIADQDKTLWGSFVVESDEGNVYFAGDTGYDQHFNEAADRFGQFELAMLPIGAYEPRWFMAEVHMNPIEAVQAHQDLNAKQSIGMHYGTFQLTFEAVDQPIMDLDRALQAADLPRDVFWTLKPGQSKRVR